MGFFKDLMKYLYPPKKYRLPPKQTINTYLITDVTEQQSLIMLLNKARSPEHAQYLLDKYDVNHISDLIPHLPQARRGITVRQRAMNLILKIAGHQSGDPYRCNQYDPVDFE